MNVNLSGYALVGKYFDHNGTVALITDYLPATETQRALYYFTLDGENFSRVLAADVLIKRYILTT